MAKYSNASTEELRETAKHLREVEDKTRQKRQEIEEELRRRHRQQFIKEVRVFKQQTP